MVKNVKYKCVACFKEDLSKNTIALNKKLLGLNIDHFYCLACLAGFLNVTTEDLLDKIEEFKEEGCTLFE